MNTLFCLALCIFCYQTGLYLQRKSRLSLLNPTLAASLFIIAFLILTGTPYESFDAGSNLISLLLGPATAALAVPIYRQRKTIRKNLLAVFAGCFVGAAVSMGSVIILCRLLGLNDLMRKSLMAKSTTTAIAVEITETLGGEPSITAAALIATGMLGAISAPLLIRLFRLKHPVAAGLAIGAASHAIGTSKAIGLGETEGAFSGIAIGVTGLLSVALVLVFA